MRTPSLPMQLPPLSGIITVDYPTPIEFTKQNDITNLKKYKISLREASLFCFNEAYQLKKFGNQLYKNIILYGYNTKNDFKSVVYKKHKERNHVISYRNLTELEIYILFNKRFY